jgi:hypothetical protein
LRVDSENGSAIATSNGSTRILNAPVHMGAIVANIESEAQEANSIWIQKIDDSSV